MKHLMLLVIGLCLMAVLPVRAQDGSADGLEGIQSFQQDKDAWRRDAEKPKQVLQPIVDSIGRTGLESMVSAEQVFCYEVDNKGNSYVGYTIDGFALKGFCGVLTPKQRDAFIDVFMKSPESVVLDKTENCIIKPKVMLRFVRGVDNVDVLLSSPCHSYSVFYGGKIKTFNVKPASNALDGLINPLLQRRQNFVSPALLKQLLPIGVVETQEQRDLISQKNKPVRGWEDGKEKPVENEEKKGGAWGNLDLKI